MCLVIIQYKKKRSSRGIVHCGTFVIKIEEGNKVDYLKQRAGVKKGKIHQNRWNGLTDKSNRKNE